jgi:hypothetical protein
MDVQLADVFGHPFLESQRYVGHRGIGVVIGAVR